MHSGGKSSFPPVFYQDASVISKSRINLESGSVLINFMGLSLKWHCIHNPNNVSWISQEDLTVRRSTVTQGESESCIGREDAPELEQWGSKEGQDTVTVQWIIFVALLCQYLPARLHRTKNKHMFNGNREFR